MDQFDRAQELDALYLSQALQMHKKRMAAVGDTLTHCLECGDEIPAARRAILPGCTHCLGCAAKLEQQRR